MTIKYKKPSPRVAAVAKKVASVAKQKNTHIAASPGKGPGLFGSADKSPSVVDKGGFTPQVAQTSASDQLDKALSSLNDSLSTPQAGLSMTPILPPGALVIMRASGGIKFSSREITVFADGKTVSRHVEAGNVGQPATESHVSAATLAEMKAHLTSASFIGSVATARHRPDSYAYELAAKIDNATRSIEVLEGAIPKSMTALLAQLKNMVAP